MSNLAVAMDLHDVVADDPLAGAEPPLSSRVARSSGSSGSSGSSTAAAPAPLTFALRSGASPLSSERSAISVRLRWFVSGVSVCSGPS
jgi:hypothetical protein